MSYHATNLLAVSCVFSTKNRMPNIPEDLQPRLWAYRGGIARRNNMKALGVGGIAGHSHILLSLPHTIAIAKAIQLVKAGSSGWIHKQAGSRRFVWQEGAFSIGASQLPATIAISRTSHGITGKQSERGVGVFLYLQLQGKLH